MHLLACLWIVARPSMEILSRDRIVIQVFTIFLAVYKHFMEAIDAIDNGENIPL